MNEIKHIHLGRQSFTISVEAYKELHEYLAAIKAQVGKRAADVVDEVEMRMAELLIERGVEGEKVVLPSDVEFLKEQLGEPHDFKDEDDEAEEHDSEKSAAEAGPKRFFRDTDNAMLAGVAAGLAAFFGIDVIIVRLLFILLTFFGGTGVLIYVILWLVVPEAHTNSERLQMRGKAVTVDSLKEVVDRANIPAAAERVGKAGQKIGTSIGRRVARVVEFVFKSILTLVGSVLLAGTVLFTIVGTAAAAYLLIHGGMMANQVVFPVGAEAVWGLLCTIIALYLGAFLTINAALMMIRRKAIARGWIIGSALTLFIIVGGIGTAIGFDIAPQIHNKYQALRHSQTTEVAPFTKLKLNGKDTEFQFVPDAKYSVEIQYFGQERKVEGVTQNVNSDELALDTTSYKNPNDVCSVFCLYNDTSLKVIVHAPTLQSVEINGWDTNLFFENNNFTAENLSLTAGQNTRIFLDGVTAAKTAVDVSTRGGHRHVALQDMRAGEWPSSIAIGDEGFVDIGRTDELQVHTGNAVCESSEALVHIDYAPRVLKLNDATIPSVTALRNMQNPDAQSAANCLSL